MEEALGLLLDEVKLIEDKESVLIASSAGRILAEDVIAPFSVPSFPKAAMDGYAVRAANVEAATEAAPVLLTVIGEQLAGEGLMFFEGFDRDSVGVENTAVRIMTGARVPEGYDAVVRQEDTDYGEKNVSVTKGVKPYINYCKVGEDVLEGDTVLKAGRIIGRIEAGVLASLGYDRIPVARRIRVDVISTGTELKEPGSPLGEYDIYSSISYMINAALDSKSFSVNSTIVGDDSELISKAIDEAIRDRRADIVITTGGVSVGKKDLLPEVLDGLGARRLFDHVNVKPGTPTMGSMIGDTVILSLSGNPYAAVANFDFYMPALLAKLTGCDAYLPVAETAVIEDEFNKTSPVRRLVRARLEGDKVSLPAKSHASSVFSNLIDCNCYVDIPAGLSVSAGERVSVRCMPW